MKTHQRLPFPHPNPWISRLQMVLAIEGSRSSARSEQSGAAGEDSQSLRILPVPGMAVGVLPLKLLDFIFIFNSFFFHFLKLAFLSLSQISTKLSLW